MSRERDELVASLIVGTITFLVVVAINAAFEAIPTGPTQTKVIVEKLSPTELEPTLDFLDDQSVRNRSVTVYYLVAEDRTMVKVDRRTWVRTRTGESFGSNRWRE